jgi:pimeloyl-ACP methyl ester carboxylesterase
MNRLIAAAAALALLLPGGVRADPPGRAADAASGTILSDPPRDAAHPARNRQLVIPSGPVVPALGRPAEMNALFFLAAGEGPKPTMLLLHGLPGNERNLDLAQAVRRAGWNVLTFTYRGAWGSEGTFSIEHAMADAQNALAFLRKPETASTYGIDTSRIVVAGHSMGGMAAALAASGDQAPAGLILLDAWNIAVTARETKAAGEAGRAAFIAGLDDLGHSLGPITAADLADEVIRRGEEWDLKALAPKLARLPVLSVYAAHGIKENNKAVVTALRAQPGARVQAVEMDSDHAFADHRVALAAEVVRWLQSL